MMAEAGVGVFINRQWLLGAEYRQKPDNLSFAREEDCWDVFITWVPDRRLAVTAAFITQFNALAENLILAMEKKPCANGGAEPAD